MILSLDTILKWSPYNSKWGSWAVKLASATAPIGLTQLSIEGHILGLPFGHE